MAANSWIRERFRLRNEAAAAAERDRVCRHLTCARRVRYSPLARQWWHVHSGALRCDGGDATPLFAWRLDLPMGPIPKVWATAWPGAANPDGGWILVSPKGFETESLTLSARITSEVAAILTGDEYDCSGLVARDWLAQPRRTPA